MTAPNQSKPYGTWQNRAKVEKWELDERRNALATFMIGETFAALPEQDRLDLAHQLAVMNEYSEVLGRRIARFGA